MASASPDDIQHTLGLHLAGRWRRLGRWFVMIMAVAVIVVAVTRMRAGAGVDAGAQYQTEPVAKGTLTVSVTATGELKPLTQVNIGTEISGIVESVSVDFNRVVRVGQVLATVNTEKLQAQAAQARAALLSAQAKRLQAEATVKEADADPLLTLQDSLATSTAQVSTNMIRVQGPWWRMERYCPTP